MAFKVEFQTDSPVITMRCPRCHQKSIFVLAGIQQLESGMLRLLLSCSTTYTHTRKHVGDAHSSVTKCGYILAFTGIVGN